MLVGDSGVGKTCLLVRFKDGAFLAGSFISTVGIDFRVSTHTPSVTIMHNSVTHTPPHTNKLRMIVMVSSDSGGRQCLSTQGDGDADR